MKIKIFFCFSLLSLFSIASDQQLDQIINLLRYGNNYTMSDYLATQSKINPFLEVFFNGSSENGIKSSYYQFADFLMSKNIYTPEQFYSFPSEARQKLFLEFQEQYLIEYLTEDYYNFQALGYGGNPTFNPLMMVSMTLSKIASSISSLGGSSENGSSNDFNENLLAILDNMNYNLASQSSFVQAAFSYNSFISENMPLVRPYEFDDWIMQSSENYNLALTNKAQALIVMLKDAYQQKIRDFGDGQISGLTPDFFSSYSDLLAAESRLNGSSNLGGSFIDDPNFKSSVTNSLSNISTNSNLIVETLNKILEQVAKTQTNNQQIADSVYWMTNNFPDEVGGVLPPGSSTGGSNDVWHVWDVFASSSRNEIKVPKIIWDEIEVDGERVLFPRYEDLKFQPSEDYNRYWSEYQNLLSEARAGNISGQEFLTGIQIFSMRFLGDISSQLMILSNQIPTKTNLWQEINHLVDDIIPQEINNLESEIQSQRSNIEQLNKSESVYGIIPAVKQIQTKIELLKQHSGNSVLRLPVPAVMRSNVDYWEVDPNSINGSAQLRTFFIWTCSVIYTIIFVRTFIVPILIIVCLGIRLMDHSLGLLFFDDTKACQVVGNWTAAAFDLFCHLIGLDTNFKKWAVGIDVNED